MSLLKSLISYFFAYMAKNLSPSLMCKVALFVLSSSVKKKSPKDALVFLLGLEKELYFLTGFKAGEYGEGIHPKHRHTQYHDYFTSRIKSGDRVLDIGCGNGALANDIASRNAFVTGIDFSQENIDKASSRYQSKKLRFICGNALTDLPKQIFDTIVLSNVLEHIEDRVAFLQAVINVAKPQRFLIRVPMFERDWRVPLMNEVGVDYRLDDTHFIEYTKSEFTSEIERSLLTIKSIDYIWGEIWCEAHV